MIYLYSALMAILSSFLWRIRGGLRFDDKKFPDNKIWYAVFFLFVSCISLGWTIENAIIGFISCYASYQLYGWGIYIGRLLTGQELDPEKDKECELIDDLLYPLHVTLKGQKYYLYQYPRWFGFCGTCLTGLIITFLWGLFLGDMIVIVSGLPMGACYWLGGKAEKICPLGKGGWNWGEWIFGLYMGIVLAWRVLW